MSKKNLPQHLTSMPFRYGRCRDGLRVAVVIGIDGCGTARLGYVVLLKVLPVHGGHGALDALGLVADAVDGGDGLSETAGAGGAGNVAPRRGQVDLVGITGEGLVVLEPARPVGISKWMREEEEED